MFHADDRREGTRGEEPHAGRLAYCVPSYPRHSCMSSTHVLDDELTVWMLPKSLHRAAGCRIEPPWSGSTRW
jgi:hypothetical protein